MFDSLGKRLLFQQGNTKIIWGQIIFTMKNNSYIRMEDIAKRMNVSIVTVSKALNGHPDIPDRTSRKVKEIANELGYIPNYFAKNIASNRSKVIGIILPNITQFFFSHMIESMYQIAYEMGYEIILKISQGNPYYEKKLIESLLSMRVDGIIISLTKDTKDISFFYQIKKLGVAITFINNVIDKFEFNKVILDDFERAFTATTYAINTGYKKISYISGQIDEFNGLDGFKSALKKNDIDIDEGMILNCCDESKTSYNLFLELYKAKKIPECFFCTNYSIMMGILKGANVLGMKIPEDVELIAVGYNSLENLPVQPLVYIEQPIEDLSRKALKLTIQNLMENDKFIPQEIKLPARYVFRNEILNSKQKFAINY